MATTYVKLQKPKPYGGTYYTINQYKSSQNSPRVKGKLKLRANSYRLWRSMIFTLSAQDTLANSHTVIQCPDPWSLGQKFPSRLESESYAKLRGKLYQGSSALGITLASAKQSKDMISSRYKQLNQNADTLIADLGSKLVNGKLRAKDVASAHLEIIFGWTPLLQDIHAATTTLVQLAVPWVTVSGVARSTDLVELKRKVSGIEITQNLHIKYLHKRAVQVSVSNPNLWLAERAGLLNPAAVAWDLVPWSFVVNMFVNTGQLVSSLTDFAGLSFPNQSSSSLTVMLYEQTLRGTVTSGFRGNGYVQGKYIEHNRNLSAISRPPVTWRVPELSFGTLTMAASLFVQKFSKRLVPLLS